MDELTRDRTALMLAFTSVYGIAHVQMAKAAIDAIHGQHTLPNASEPLVVRWADAPGSRKRDGRESGGKRRGGGPNGANASGWGMMQMGPMGSYGGYPHMQMGGMGSQMMRQQQQQQQQVGGMVGGFGNAGFYGQSGGGNNGFMPGGMMPMLPCETTSLSNLRHGGHTHASEPLVRSSPRSRGVASHREGWC